MSEGSSHPAGRLATTPAQALALRRKALDSAQQILAKAAHPGDHRVGRVAAKIEIDVADPDIAQRPEIANDVGALAGKQPALPVIGAGRQ